MAKRVKKEQENNLVPLPFFELDKKKEACTAFKGLLDTYKELDKTLKERAQKEIKELKCSQI